MNEHLTMIGRGPDLDVAEQSVLGAVLHDNDAMDRIPDLRASHFYSRDHQLIYGCMQAMANANRPIDAITVYEHLGNKIEGALAYLTSLYTNTPGSAGIQRYAEIVMDRAVKRAIAQVASEMMELAATRTPALQLVEQAGSKLDALQQLKTRKEPKRLSQALANYAETIQKRIDGTVTVVPTGFRDLDKKLGGGLKRKAITVVAGRPAMGKSAFGFALGRNAASSGLGAFFSSMEMDEDQICDRAVASMGHVPVGWLMQPSEAPGAENDKNWTGFSHGAAQSENLALYIDDETSLTIGAIRSKARTVKRLNGGKLDVLVLDQLSFIVGSDAEKLQEQIAEYSRGLLAMAKELNVAVVLLAQLNRKVEERPNKRPVPSDLANSGNLEQDADTILLLYRDEVYNPDTQDKGVAEIIIGKQRNGPTGIVGLAYIGEETRFENLAREYTPAATSPTRRGKSEI